MNVVWVRFTQTSVRDLNKLRVVDQGWNVLGANVAHPGAQTADHLEDHVSNVALVFNPEPACWLR